MLGWRDERLLADVLPTKEATAMTRAFGYVTCHDLLEHIPRDWSRHGSGVLAEDALEGDMITCVGEVIAVREFHTRDGKNITRLTINDGRTVFTASFFNSVYVGRVLRQGSKAMFSGKLKFFRGEPQLQHPDFLLLPGPGEKAAGSLKAFSLYGDPDEQLRDLDYVPIYPASAKMASWRIMAAIGHILRTLEPVPEPLGEVPDGLVSFDAAIRGVHFPGPKVRNPTWGGSSTTRRSPSGWSWHCVGWRPCAATPPPCRRSRTATVPACSRPSRMNSPPARKPSSGRSPGTWAAANP